MTMITILTIVLLVLLDQGTKYLVVKNLKGMPPKVIIQNFFQLQYVENRGAAFGIFQEKRNIFIIVTFIVLSILFYMLFIQKDPLTPFLRWSLIFIASGTLGNFIDRLHLHYVVDFFSFKIFGYHFAVFNVADVFIVVGTFMLILHILISGDEHDA